MRQSVVSGASELLPHSELGRRFTDSRTVRLGDVDPSATMRLDATARYLQDVATDDATECGLDGRFGWLVRRTLIEVVTPARLGEVVELTTSCTGVGRSWAERRTSLTGSLGAEIETVSIWVQVDGTTGRPTRITDQFLAIYGEACAGRAVSARLSLDPPPAEASSTSWAVRRTDLDPFNHVNNAANWAFLEEAVGDHATRRGTAVMEFLAPVEPDTVVELRSVATPPNGTAAWLVVGGQVTSAARWVGRA